MPDEDDDADADIDDDTTVIHDNQSSDDDDYNDDEDASDTYSNYPNDADYTYNYNDYLDADNNDDDDDDDDDSYIYCSSDEDDYYNNNPNVIFDMHGNQCTIDDNDNVVPYDNKPMTLQAAQRQINAILAGCTTPLVLLRNLPNKPSKDTTISFFLRRPIVQPP